MITAVFNIRFEFPVDAAHLSVALEADVKEHHSDTYYKVTNFRIPGHVGRPLLPEITIRKEQGIWVHTDSGKATNLSAAAGAAIEAKLSGSI